MGAERAGGCACGAVRFAARLVDETVVACHCGQCRRQSGHHWASVNAERETLSLEGAEALRWHQSSATAKRGFCGECGSWLFWRDDADTHISVSAGALDDPSGLRLVADIFTEGRPEYYALCGEVPRYLRGRSEPPVA